MPDRPPDESTIGDVNSTNREDQAPFVENMALRIRNLAESRFNASSLGSALGIAKSSAALYWAGKRPWPVECLPDMARLLSTNVDALLGEATSQLSDRRLGFRGAEPDRSDLIEIAQYDVAYGMGSSYLHDDYVEPQRMIFSRAWVRHFTSSPFDQIFFAQGIGDSMTPTIGSSDIVLIDTAQRTPRQAELIWAVEMHGLGMIKRLRPAAEGAVLLIADNPAISAIPCADGEMNIIGRVVAVVKRL